MKHKPVLVFDLVGTLLDLSALDPAFREMFGASLRQEWFSEILKIVFSTTLAGGWNEFAKIAEAALKVIEERHDRKLSWFERRRILKSMRELPVFPDVAPGLQQLKADGYKLAILTNSSIQTARVVLGHNRVEKLFDRILSADTVKRLKPAPEPYLRAAKDLRSKPGQLLFVAAHAWDIRGAYAAGLRTCFLQRPAQVYDELAPEPDFFAPDLLDLAAQLRRGKR